MMAAFNVTALPDLGYDEKASFIDPMEPRYRPKSFADSDFTGRRNDFSDAAIQAKVGFFNDLDAYRNVAAVESRLSAYWQTATPGSGNSPGSLTSGLVSATVSGSLGSTTSDSAGSSASGSSTSASLSSSRIASVSTSTSAPSTSSRASATSSVRASPTTSGAATTTRAASSSARSSSSTLRTTTTTRV
jgi:bilirubin oxidase